MTALAPDAPTAAGYRLLVRSIGTADAAVIGALRRVRVAPDAELAGLLYRAPSELLSGVDRELGTRLRDVLRGAGMEVDLVPASESFEPGAGEYEVALVLRRYDRLLPVIEQTARILGVPADAAMKIVSATPAVLLGGVSRATVEALRARYAPLGVEVDASRTADARFDIALEFGDEPTRRLLAGLLAGEGAEATRTGDDQYLVADVSAAVAREIWEWLSRTAARIRVLNRDFERFDVRLDSAPATPVVRDWLVERIGMPPAVAEIAPTRTPLIVAETIPLPEAMDFLASAHAVGARASAVLLALQGFSLRVKGGVDRKGARSLVEAIAGAEEAERFSRGAPELLGPFTKTQARWLQHELRQRGITSQLAER
jgi:hypothetical protein